MKPQESREEIGQRYTKSWAAYVSPVIVLLILLVIGLVVGNYSGLLGTLLVLFGIAVFITWVLNLRSVVLYADEHGVWIKSGIFPWSKGVNGVKWRDVEDAVYYTGFKSWLLKSYTVRIGHRFTKSSEIVVTHVAHGDDAVQHINGLLRNSLATHPDAVTA